MPNLSRQKEEFVLGCLVNGTSIRATERITRVHRDTVLKVLFKRGMECRTYLRWFVNRWPKDRWQIDEIWTYVKKKEDNLTEEEQKDRLLGTQYIFYAMAEKTKFVPMFTVGKRDARTTRKFLTELKERLPKWYKPRVSSDAFKPYTKLVAEIFGDNIEYGQLKKNYLMKEERKTNPDVPFIQREIIIGDFPEDEISTSFMERFNATSRNDNKRLTRKTYAHSKKWKNLEASLALQLINYNFVRVHRTLKTTPAMAAKLATRPYTLPEVIKWAGDFHKFFGENFPDMVLP